MALKIKDFSLKFGKQLFFQDLSFELEKGGLHTLSGKNGCGKSTLLAALRGDLSADLNGTVEIAGEPYPISHVETLREKRKSSKERIYPPAVALGQCLKV